MHNSSMGLKLSCFYVLYTVIVVGLICLYTKDTYAGSIKPIALWKLDESAEFTKFENFIRPGYAIGICSKKNMESLCPQTVQGRYGLGKKFNYESEPTGITIPYEDLFKDDGKGSFSISVWLKRDGTNIHNREVLIGRNNPKSKISWMIGIDQYGKAMVDFKREKKEKTPAVSLYLVTNKNLSDNTWHQIIFTRDSKNSESSLYVDGKFQYVIYLKFGFPNSEIFQGKGHPITLGWSKKNSLGSNFRGILDEIAIYDTALPESFIVNSFHDDIKSKVSNSKPCK